MGSFDYADSLGSERIGSAQDDLVEDVETE